MALDDANVHALENLSLASFEDLLDPNSHHRLKIGIDFGTMKSCVCWDIVDTSTLTSVQKPAPAEFRLKDIDGGSIIPSVVVAYWGHPPDIWMAFGSKAVALDDSAKAWKDLGMIKLLLIPEGHPVLSYDNVSAEMVSTLRQEQKGAMILAPYDPKQTWTDYVVVQDPFTKEWSLFNDIPNHPGGILEAMTATGPDIAREFLHYLLQSTKASIAETTKFSRDQVETIFNTKTDVALSIPTIWDSAIKEHLKKLLDDAVYPRATYLVGEAHSAALFHHFEEMKHRRPQTNHVKIIVDIGGGTADISCVSVDNANQGTAKVVEVVPGIGSLDGSQRLNELFAVFLEQAVGSMSALLAEVPGQWYYIKGNQPKVELHTRRAFQAGFETVKRMFDHGSAPGSGTAFNNQPVYKIQPIPQLKLDPKDHKDFIVTTSEILMPRATIAMLFTTWLRRIKEMIEDRFKAIWQKHPGVAVTIVLTGGGSLPPFVPEAIRHHFTGIEVQTTEDFSRLSVAQGNYISLCLEDPSMELI